MKNCKIIVFALLVLATINSFAENFYVNSDIIFNKYYQNNELSFELIEVELTNELEPHDKFFVFLVKPVPREDQFNLCDINPYIVINDGNGKKVFEGDTEKNILETSTHCTLRLKSNGMIFMLITNDKHGYFQEIETLRAGLQIENHFIQPVLDKNEV